LNGGRQSLAVATTPAAGTTEIFGLSGCRFASQTGPESIKETPDGLHGREIGKSNKYYNYNTFIRNAGYLNLNEFSIINSRSLSA
jgi:hypothetical protein